LRLDPDAEITPCELGSGKLGTPFARMHWANLAPPWIFIWNCVLPPPLAVPTDGGELCEDEVVVPLAARLATLGDFGPDPQPAATTPSTSRRRAARLIRNRSSVP
jgi:hypothetical protein